MRWRMAAAVSCCRRAASVIDPRSTTSIKLSINAKFIVFILFEDRKQYKNLYLKLATITLLKQFI
jgi:hypothetical protein